MTPRTGLYIHWPFCARICPYCDFTVAKARDVDVAAWIAAYLEDLDRVADWIGPREMVSVYFGGGTPALMPPDAVAALLEGVARRFRLDPEAEITLEANPNDATAERCKGFAAAGVNRLSLGVQSFDDGQLAFLGRDHSAGAAKAAVDAALGAFPRMTFDLIYALPGETAAAWAARLREAIALGAGHLSLYQLTIEAGTAFAAAVARGDWTSADEDLAAALYEVTQEVTAAAGLPAYEVSNHAAPGQEAVHNALYWQGADWIGIGPGAHGRLTVEGQRYAVAGPSQPAAYLKTSASARYDIEAIAIEGAAIERIAGGLRPLAGMPLDDLPAAVSARIAPAHARLVQEGWLESTPGRLVVAPRGRLLIDRLVGELIADL